MRLRSSASLFAVAALVWVPSRVTMADALIDHFEGDSLKAHWTVSGASGTYSVGGGSLHVTDIDTAPTWSDMLLTAHFAAQGDFSVSLGFDYPYILFKRMAIILLDAKDSVVAHCMLEDSPSDYLVFDVDTCYEYWSRPSIPTWITVARTGGVITAVFEGYAARSCATPDTVASIRLLFSRYGVNPFNGISIDSIVASSTNIPSVANITFDGDTVRHHLTNHTPLVAWSYTHADSTDQQLIDLEVGTDSNWLNGAESWVTQLVGASTSAPYDGDSLMDGEDYWLRIRAFDGALWGLWTESMFHMNSLPTVPIQVTPSDFGEASSNPPMLTAVIDSDGESDSQQLQFGIYIDDSILVQESGLLPALPGEEGDTVAWTAPDTLHENWFYFWSVRAFDGYEITPRWGNLEFFFVNAVNEIPSAVALAEPIGDGIVHSYHPTFVWTASHDLDPVDTIRYEFQIAANALFSGALVVDSLTDTLLSLFTPLEAGTRYWWRCISRDNHGLDTTSLASQFRVYRPGDANDSWTITSADIITVVNFVFKGQTMTVPDCVGNVNGDGTVTSADIIWLVNTIFKGGAAPIPGCG